MKKSAEKLEQLLTYEKFSNIDLLNLPQVEKENIPDYIQCPKYEKKKGKLDNQMKRENDKVDRFTAEIRQMKADIAEARAELAPLQAEMSRSVYKGDMSGYPSLVQKYNDMVPRHNGLLEYIKKTSEKHDNTIDKLTEAEEDAKEKLEELTADALEAIDEDIPAVINRLEGIADNFSTSENAEDLLAAIDVCLIGLCVYAMFDDLIDDNSARRDCKESIEKINKIFASLCADDNVQNYVVDVYKRNLDLLQNNAGINKQINGVLGAVDQKQLDTFIQSINAVLTEKINTNFNYSQVIEQSQLDKVVGEINTAITALKVNLDKANKLQGAEAPPVVLAKAGVNADKQAKSLRATMQTNVDALGDPISKNHFAVRIIDEAVIDDFYQKDLRVAASALRKHIVDTIGEQNFEGVLKDDGDRFALAKAQKAIEDAKLTRLQDVLDKVPAHVKDITAKITAAEADIQKANNTMKENQRKAEEARIEAERKAEQSRQWQSQGLCRHCGGKIGGLFGKKCKSCKSKDY